MSFIYFWYLNCTYIFCWCLGPIKFHVLMFFVIQHTYKNWKYFKYVATVTVDGSSVYCMMYNTCKLSYPLLKDFRIRTREFTTENLEAWSHLSLDRLTRMCHIQLFKYVYMLTIKLLSQELIIDFFYIFMCVIAPVIFINNFLMSYL